MQAGLSALMFASDKEPVEVWVMSQEEYHDWNDRVLVTPEIADNLISAGAKLNLQDKARDIAA